MTTLPNGRQIEPAGKWIPVAPYPFAVAIRGDGKQAAVPSIGYPFALNVIDDPASDHPRTQQFPRGKENDPAVEVHAGVAYSPDGMRLYVATGDTGKVRAYRTSDWSIAGEASLDGSVQGRSFEKSFAGALTISKNGKLLYVVDEANWRVVVLNTELMKTVGSVGTGRYPFGLALSPDGTKLYVTNTGLFEYRTIPGVQASANPAGGLRFPPFGYPSAAARKGAAVEGKHVPGLGDENSDEGSSIWTIDVSDPAKPVVVGKLRLGERVSASGRGAIGGSAPTGVAAGADGVYVSLAHADSVVKISADGTRVLAEAQLSPFTGAAFEDAQHRPLRGVMPSGLALHGDRLYVAESGINAVAVVETATMHVIEHIPVGWNPAAVAVDEAGQDLVVVNAKGKGAGPNGGSNHDPHAPTYIGSLELGSLSVIPLADRDSPDASTKRVVALNTTDVADHSRLPRLKHCFLIIRENRTFDEVLGDLPGVDGDASLARFGIDGWAELDDQADYKRVSTPGAKHLSVTPNLHALARQFAVSDNFFVESEVSADGHRWVVGINPTPFFNTAWTSNYGGRRHEDARVAQPGRRALFGGADGPMPEDEPQFGSLWEHVAAGGTSGPGILNYGEGLELEGNDERAGAEPEGQRLLLNAPLPLPVFEASDRRFPTFNLGIPDQMRVEEFERDFSRRLAAGKIPGLIVIRLPNDHTAEPRPKDGYPYRASYVADNDLALGRIVAFLSKTPIWKDSALFVTEDDAQGGVDHVDAHRSILLVASPWVKPGTVAHGHSSMGSIIKTIDELLGLGPLNLEDALAGDLAEMFDMQPHEESFKAVPADARVFVPAHARVARPKTKKEAAELRDMDDAVEIQEQLKKSAESLHRPR
ncbi:bifunctional YncE family protein/alkaline phosphatase family protein [Occallatibacter savannae]|uniref:bifunctional YncE family protein/alkaline phosphatase family protein n=1 Tax=Occallatibacter savannae TaxID=1002691 RepID=UPI0013A54846|nr:bifunctional YncE family protein/alkaline phosphatase family protein [Occallatibacter savannae]